MQKVTHSAYVKPHRIQIMSDQLSRLHTVGEISERLSEPLHRVEYVIKARKIEPIAWAGNARVFSSDAARVIAEALGHPQNLNHVAQGQGGSADA